MGSERTRLRDLDQGEAASVKHTLWCCVIMMRLSLFRSVNDPREYGFTADAAGNNLPQEYAPWEHFDDAALAVDGILAPLTSSEHLAQVVERDGFYIMRIAAIADDTKTYIFASETHTAVSGFTSDPAGNTLPADYAPWRPVSGRRAKPIARKTDAIAEVVKRDGFFLLSGKTTRNR